MQDFGSSCHLGYRSQGKCEVQPFQHGTMQHGWCTQGLPRAQDECKPGDPYQGRTNTCHLFPWKTVRPNAQFKALLVQTQNLELIPGSSPLSCDNMGTHCSSESVFSWKMEMKIASPRMVLRLTYDHVREGLDSVLGTERLKCQCYEGRER